MKRVIAILICLSIVFMQSAVFAQELVDVVLDGELMEFDVPAQIINDRTMVPMRGIFEKLGAEVEWLEEDEIVFALRNERLITMKIGQNFYTVANVLTDEEIKKDLDVAPMIISDRTLVPVRAVAESLDCLVDWDEATQTVFITTKSE